MACVSLKAQILAQFSEASLRLTPQALEKNVRIVCSETTRSEIRSAINALVAEGVLRYTHRYGFSQLEPNYSGLHRVSDRLWLAPVEYNQPPPFDGVVIKLAVGASFGGGDHPTTRLALQALDMAVGQLKYWTGRAGSTALDIGAGSGVLVLAAVSLGVESALAIDIDPLACHETMENIRCNGLEGRIAVSNQPLESQCHPPFDLLLANLRPPTLKMLFVRMQEYTADNGLWVLSGFRCAEMATLRDHAEQAGRTILWESTAHDWGAWLIHCPPMQ
jgi:ribosomal protein L11 methyltransferase